MELSPAALLAFVDECDPEERPPATGLRRPSSKGPEGVATNRPRRKAVDMAALKSQVEALTLELAQVKAGRHINERALLPGQSRWLIEAQRQSRMRTAAQEENERLRAQMQWQMRVAKRLASVLKRNSINQVVGMLQRYELEARQRAETTRGEVDNDLELAYLQTDAALFDAEMFSLPPVFFDTRMRRANCPGGLSIEFRRSLRVPHGRDVTSDAFWQFIPRQTAYKQFIFNHNMAAQSDSMDNAFLFQCEHGPSQASFTGRFQLRRYTTDERVVIVWKTLLQSSPQLRLHGQGWVEIKSVAASAPSTSVHTFARYYADCEAKGVWTPAAQQNAELRVLIEFVTRAMENYGAFPSHSALLQA